MVWGNNKYEYISVEVEWLLKDVTELNKYGEEGWRLVCIAQQNILMPAYAIFEKVKTE